MVEEDLSLSCVILQWESLFYADYVFCLRVIGNEILINLEKATSGDLSVTLINLQGRTQEQV